MWIYLRKLIGFFSSFVRFFFFLCKVNHEHLLITLLKVIGLEIKKLLFSSLFSLWYLHWKIILKICTIDGFGNIGNIFIWHLKLILKVKYLKGCLKLLLSSRESSNFFIFLRRKNLRFSTYDLATHAWIIT